MVKSVEIILYVYYLKVFKLLSRENEIMVSCFCKDMNDHRSYVHNIKELNYGGVLSAAYRITLD